MNQHNLRLKKLRKLRPPGVQQQPGAAAQQPLHGHEADLKVRTEIDRILARLGKPEAAPGKALPEAAWPKRLIDTRARKEYEELAEGAKLPPKLAGEVAWHTLDPKAREDLLRLAWPDFERNAEKAAERHRELRAEFERSVGGLAERGELGDEAKLRAVVVDMIARIRRRQH